jgi:hypothetical protein
MQYDYFGKKIASCGSDGQIIFYQVNNNDEIQKISEINKA